MKYINNLGVFDTYSAVWEAYPYGGKEGDYVIINGDNIGWDKYAQRWEGESASTSAGNQTEVEHIVAPEGEAQSFKATLYINFLGVFPTIEDVWKAYPYGGKEGDYVTIDGVDVGWNKYASKWDDEASDVSAGNQPEATPPTAEPSIPTSYDITSYINNLGDFESIEDVWKAYPYGGKEGDYILLNGEKIGWNKYTNNWGDDTTDVSAGNQPEVTPPSAEPSTPSSYEISLYLNDLGSFASIVDVWKAYPYGGKEGDYVTIDGEQIGWNKYTKTWGDDTSEVTHPALSEEVEGDLIVYGDLRVIGQIFAPNLISEIPIDGDTIIWKDGKLASTCITQTSLEEYVSQELSSYITQSALDSKLSKFTPLTKLDEYATLVKLQEYTPLIALNEYATKEWVLELAIGGGGDIDTSEFVTLSATQTITGLKTFAYGLNVGGINIKESQDGILFIDGDIIVSGAITQYALGDNTTSTIMDAIVVDDTTISKEGGILRVIGGTGGSGLDVDELYDYLTTNGYITEQTLTNKGYITATSVNNLLKNYVLKDTAQDITAQHNFVNGLKIGGLGIVKSQDDVIFIDSNVIVRGAITQYGTDSTTASTIMDAIVVDDTTISKDGGVLKVIGGTGGGGIDEEQLQSYLDTNKYITSSSLAPYITSASVNTLLQGYVLKSVLDETIAALADIYVDFSSDQNIKGIKSFINGFNIGEDIKVYKSQDGAVFIDGNLILKGSLTQYGTDATTASTIMDAIVVDDTTISKDGGVLHFIGEVTGGLDEEQLQAYLDANGYIDEEVLLSKGYATTSSVSEYVLSEVATLNTLIATKANKATTLAGYGITDAYTKNEINTSLANYVKLATAQDITAQHNFVNGLKIGGLALSSTQDDIVFLDANLVVRGAITQYGTDTTTASTIMDAIEVDGTTISKDGGVLKVIGGTGEGGGISLADVETYLNDEGYITSTALAPYATSSSVSSALTNYLPLSSFTKATIKSTLGISDWALASTKPSYSWTDITSRPTNLSQFTDDVVAGKYLPLSGGTLDSGAYIAWNSGSSGNDVSDWNAVNSNGLRIISSTTTTSNAPTQYSTALHIKGRYGFQIASAGGAASTFYIRNIDSNANSWLRIIHSGNYSDYALPLTGGTISGTLTLSKEGSDIFVINRLNSSSPTTITYRKDGSLLGRMGFDASTKEPVVQMSGTYQTLIHSGNYADYALPLSGGTLTGNLTAPTFIGNLTGTADNANSLGGESYHSFARYTDENGYIGFYIPNSSIHHLGQDDGYIEYYDGGWYNAKWGKVTAVNGFIGNLTGNADSATKLATPRTIWGQSFDGTGNVGGSIYMSKGNRIMVTDGADTRTLISLTTGNKVSLGYAAIPEGYETLIYGNTVSFRYGRDAGYSMRIDSSGNVGIGTTSPSAKLHVKGNTKLDGTLTLNNGLMSYDSTNQVWTLNGSLLVTGGVTQYGTTATSISTIMDGVEVDNETISKEGGMLKVIGNAGGDATIVELNASLLTVGSTFYISEAQLSTIKAQRNGVGVIVQDSNRITTESEWGQVISCYREYAGSSLYTYRVTILHKSSTPLSGADNAKLYNIDIMDQLQSSGYYCTVTSVNSLY